ncbi:MAG: response regulator [Lachnospiraceae bacterium]|nr:response regulator [Lachnospiraceae bacterium]
MYSVLIVDDEAHIRDALKSITDWNALGFSICGEASDGENALQMILSLQPDLTLMDIHIPAMQGLQVIKAAREQGFQGRFIIISNYSDFKYAQEAILYNVEAYFSKPIDKDALCETVCKIKQSLDNEYRSIDNIELIKRQIRNLILRELITGECDASVNLSPEDMAALELSADTYQVVICESFNPISEDPTYSFADLLKVTNREEHTFNDFEEGGKHIILLKGTYALNRFRDFLNHYHGATPPQKGSPMDTLFLAYGCPVQTLEEIPLSYEDACRLMNRRFFCRQSQHTLGYEALSSLGGGTRQLTPELLSEYTEYLVGYLQTFNRKHVADTLHKLEKYLYHVQNSILEIKLFLADLYLCIKERIHLVYNTVTIPFSTNSEVISFITQRHYLYEITQFLSEQFEMIMSATGNPNRNSVLDDILYYIDHNYQNNIKLESIAPLFGYNSAYLGKIFNKTVGESFNSYVDHMRIEHSKKLLLQNKYKVYEIAERVGYRNVDYFHKKFRKYVGESPVEFRKKNGGTVEV